MKCLILSIAALMATSLFGFETSDIAAHNLQVQKAIKAYEAGRVKGPGKGYPEAYDKMLQLQKKHRVIYDKIKIGDSIFLHKGLLTLGEIRFYDNQEYRLSIGFSPNWAGDNREGITKLMIHFDGKGIITKKAIPRYKW